MCSPSGNQDVDVAKLTTFKLQLVEAAKYGPDSGQRIRRSLQIEMFIYFQYVSTYASGMKWDVGLYYMNTLQKT